mmetsp:Transcript_10960/g.13730  ORF Transcript_10960/g.13730 Transcript_10960/m.13730 type:complete len:99 (-) Transcript_10960:24-320(-)
MQTIIKSDNEAATPSRKSCGGTTIESFCDDTYTAESINNHHPNANSKPAAELKNRTLFRSSQYSNSRIKENIFSLLKNGYLPYLILPFPTEEFSPSIK